MTNEELIESVESLLGIGFCSWHKANPSDIADAFRKALSAVPAPNVIADASASHQVAPAPNTAAWAQEVIAASVESGLNDIATAKYIRALDLQVDGLITAPAQQAPAVPDERALTHVMSDDEMKSNMSRVGFFIDLNLRNTLFDLLDSGKWGKARALLSRQPVAQQASAVPSNDVIELAQALEQDRALKIVEDVSILPIGGKDAEMPTGFQAGYQLACEEIEHRLKTEVWGLCLPPIQNEQGKEGGV